MRRKLMMFAAAAMVATVFSGAMAQVCPPGYVFNGGVCQSSTPPGYGYSNPVSGLATGAASGGASGAATGSNVAGPVGAVIGGTLGTATGIVTGTVSGTAGMLTPAAPPVPATCPLGYMNYNGSCYPAR